MLLDNLKEIASDLTKYQDLDSEQLFTLLVAQKLDYQLDKYIMNLDKEIFYVLNSDEMWGSGKTLLYKGLTQIQLDESNKLKNIIKGKE